MPQIPISTIAALAIYILTIYIQRKIYKSNTKNIQKSHDILFNKLQEKQNSQNIEIQLLQNEISKHNSQHTKSNQVESVKEKIQEDIINCELTNKANQNNQTEDENLTLIKKNREHEEEILALREKLEKTLSAATSAAASRNRLQQEINTLKQADTSITEENSQAKSQLNQLNQEIKSLIQKNNELTEQLIEVNQKFSELEKVQESRESLENLQKKLLAFEEQHELVAAGLYPISLDFGTPDELKHKLEEIRQELAHMIRSKSAAICSTKWTINGSTADGTKATKHYIRIMLRTFNADADACLDLVRWNSLEKCEARLQASFEYVNLLGSSHATQLQQPYLDARLRQLRLMHSYKESVYRRREAMRAARQLASEERRAAREIERARAEAEAEETRYLRAIEKARSEIENLVGAEKDRMLSTISILETKLQEASNLKQRAISMAQITKAGFVYVVSNVGSFGSDVLKIGMTRRIDPHERIRELGGASVPFHFDVHAMIYSDNAPDLENTFHKYFTKQRINLANGRKEFFRLQLTEVVNFSKQLGLETEFSIEPEAKDFKISSQIRETVLSSISDEELNKRLTITDGEQDSLIEDEDDL